MPSTPTPDDLPHLAALIAARNEWEREISAIIGRPASLANLGETVAATIFHIRLHEDGSHQGSDGLFVDGPLMGLTVNVKWYARLDYLLDLAPGYPDAYLVLAGPRLGSALPARHTHPWLITSLHLFIAERLIGALHDIKLETATNIKRALWDEAELYPNPNCPDYTLSDAQREMIGLFGEGSR